MITPVPYTPDVEQPEADEDKVIADMVETLLTISRTTYADTHHAMRSVHVKSHALLTGTVEILDNPQPYAQGLFATPGSHDIVMRISTSPGDMLPDKVSTPRGMAVKVLGPQDQDFVLVNSGPKFQVPNAKVFLAQLKPLVPTTDKMTGVKVAASAVFQATEKVIEAVGGTSANIRTMGGEPANHPLGETFYSQVPFRFGDYIAKFSIAPVSPELEALSGEKLDTHDPLAIRNAMIDHFAIHGGVWEIRAQLNTDLDAMPIEKGDADWSQDDSPYVAVARITVAPQDAWTEEKAAQIDDGMAFSPWHCLEAHRPLGSLNRVRKTAYEASQAFRKGKTAEVVAGE